MSSRTPTEQRVSRRSFFQSLVAAVAGVFTIFSPKARAYDTESDWDDLEFGPRSAPGGQGKGQEKAAKGREEALKHGRGKGLEKAPPMSPPPPPPPTTPPPGL